MNVSIQTVALLNMINNILFIILSNIPLKLKKEK